MIMTSGIKFGIGLARNCFIFCFGGSGTIFGRLKRLSVVKDRWKYRPEAPVGNCLLFPDFCRIFCSSVELIRLCLALVAFAELNFGIGRALNVDLLLSTSSFVLVPSRFLLLRVKLKGSGVVRERVEGDLIFLLLDVPLDLKSGMGSALKVPISSPFDSTSLF